MTDEPARIGETLNNKLLAGDGPTVRAYRQCCTVRGCIAEMGGSLEDEQEAVRAIWVQHNPSEYPDSAKVWADEHLETLRGQYRDYQARIRAERERDQASVLADSEELEPGGGAGPPAVQHQASDDTGGGEDGDVIEPGEVQSGEG